MRLGIKVLIWSACFAAMVGLSVLGIAAARQQAEAEACRLTEQVNNAR